MIVLFYTIPISSNYIALFSSINANWKQLYSVVKHTSCVIDHDLIPSYCDSNPLSPHIQDTIVSMLLVVAHFIGVVLMANYSGDWREYDEGLIINGDDISDEAETIQGSMIASAVS